MVCHPSRTLLPKESWQELQNRSFPFLTTKPCPLTSDPWLHCACIGWWGLGLVRAFLPCMFKKSSYFSLIRRGLEACLYSLPFVLWNFMWAAFWFSAPLRGWYLFITGLYTSFSLFLDCPHFLPYYSIIHVIMTQSCWASLGLLFTLSPSGLTWPLVFPFMGSCVPFFFLFGHPWLVCFLWVSSSLLLTLHSHGLLLTSLDFLVPILHSHRL